MLPVPSGQSNSIKDAVREIEQLPRTPIYGAHVPPEALLRVRRRCAGTNALNEALEVNTPESIRAIRDRWQARASGVPPSEAFSAWSASLPEAFRFDEYENLKNYAAIVPVGDQTAVESRQTEYIDDALAPILHISVYSRRHNTLTRHTADSDEQHSIDGSFVLTQRIEAAATNSLGDLAKEISCRNSEIPARCDAHASEIQPLWTAAEEISDLLNPAYPAFTGGVLETDTCMMVKRTLHGKLPYDEPGSYVHALVEYGRSARESPFHGATEGAALDQVSLGELSASLEEPNWLLHVGDCEHRWTVDWVTADRNAVYPRTIYLSRWIHTTLPRQYLAPKRLVVRDKGHLPCEICAGICGAVVAVVGGDQVCTPRLRGLPQMITPMCASCFRTTTGVDVKEALGKPRTSWGVVPLVPIDACGGNRES